MGNVRYQRVDDPAVSLWSGGRPVSETVVAAVAEYSGVDVSDLDPPLYEAIDPDALDALFREGEGSVRVAHWGCTVTVDHDGVVTVTNGEDNR